MVQPLGEDICAKSRYFHVRHAEAPFALQNASLAVRLCRLSTLADNSREAQTRPPTNQHHKEENRMLLAVDFCKKMV